MIHGKPLARHNASAVRAVQIISLSEESEVEDANTLLLTEFNRRRASGASDTPDDEVMNPEKISGRNKSNEWLFIDEA